MNTLLGLLIIAVGSFCQSSSYVPIKKVKEWSWESFWLVQGIFAWLVFPLLGALLAVPAGSSLGEILSTDPSAAFKAAGYGVLWGVGGLTFGLSMRYLGVALGQSIALGTCAGFGTLFPAIFAGENLFAGKGLVLLLGVSITLAGIAVIGYAGSLRSQNMTDEDIIVYLTVENAEIRGRSSDENSPDSITFEAEILEIRDGYFLVKPEAGWAINSAALLEVPMENMEPSPALQVGDRKSTRLNSSHPTTSRMPSSA